ncbi:MAG TPA: hypothetical protein VE262_12515 [Blastocatellia bacterium]|nr:hypothetical protein [Blastocatellia bacterium]
MSNNKLLSGSRNFITLILVLVGCVFLSTSSWSSSNQSDDLQDKLPEVKNRTESFHLVGVERVGRLLQLRLRNTSGKSITAYRISASDGWETGIDYILGDESVAPGEEEEFQTPLSNLVRRDAQGVGYQDVTISAVVFEDKSIEGDFNSGTFILNDRRGQKVQLNRINREIQSLFKEADTDQLSALSKLKSRVAALPEKRPEGEPIAFQVGLHYMKQHVLKQIEDIEQWSKSKGSAVLPGELQGSRTVREGLTKLMDLNNKRAAKL